MGTGMGNAGGTQFEGILNAVLGLATSIPIVFVNGRPPHAFPATHTPAQGTTPMEPKPDAQPSTTPMDQTSPANLPLPPSLAFALAYKLRCFGFRCNQHDRELTLPILASDDARARQLPLPSPTTSSPTNAHGRQEPAAPHSHASGSSGPSRPQRRKWVCPEAGHVGPLTCRGQGARSRAAVRRLVLHVRARGRRRGRRGHRPGFALGVPVVGRGEGIPAQGAPGPERRGMTEEADGVHACVPC